MELYSYVKTLLLKAVQGKRGNMSNSTDLRSILLLFISTFLSDIEELVDFTGGDDEC